MQRDKGFTLIELLVVIAVIGLLSSVVLVSLNLPQRKYQARVAKSLDLSVSIQNILGSEGVGTWNFDEGSGNIARDSSGYGNNGAINGASYVSDTAPAVAGAGTGKYALSFNGSADYVEVNDPGSNFTGDKTQALSIEGWAKPNTLNPGQSIVSKDIPTWSSRWVVDIGTSGKLRFFHARSGAEVFSNDALTANQWNHFAVTWQPGTVKIYLNGVLDKTASIGSDLALSENGWLHIGRLNSGGGWSNAYGGLIDEIRIYGKALNSAEIQKHYAAGLTKHL